MESLLPPWPFVLILMFLFGWQLLSRGPTRKNLPPGPFNLPIIGCLHRLGSLPHLSLHSLSQKFGGVMYLKLGTVPFVVVSSCEAAEELYKYHSLSFASKAPTIAGKYFGNNFTGIVFSGYTTELKLYRKLANTHLLSPSRLKVYAGVRREEQCILAKAILSAAGKPLKLRDKFIDLNMNTISYMLLGERFYGPHARNTPQLDAFVEAVVESLRVSGVFNIADYIPALRWLDIQGLERRYKELMAKINEYLRSILEDRRKNPRELIDPVPYVDWLLSLDSTQEEISDTTKMSLIFDMFLGAIDTSSLVLEWAMAELIRHPKVLERAREEVQNVVGKSRLVEESDLIKVPYIEAIAKETLRVHPLAPLALPKVLNGGPCKLGGYTIPDGTHAFVNFHSLGIDASSWKDTDLLQYRPERFLDSNVDVFGQDVRLLPFGAGRRSCPGAKFGFDALQIGVALLAQGFEWSLPEGEVASEMDMETTFGLVCHKSKPLVVVAKPLLEASVYAV